MIISQNLALEVLFEDDGHDCMDAGGRAKPGAFAEEAQVLPKVMPRDAIAWIAYMDVGSRVMQEQLPTEERPRRSFN